MSDLVQEPGHIWKNDVDIDTGSFTGVLAASGKGKTSLLSYLYGVRTDYIGIIRFDDKNIKDFSLNDWSEIRKNKISCVFQDLRLISHLTAMENLLLKNNLTGYYTESEITKMAAQLGMENKLGQKCGLLSLGQKQRIAIVRGLLQPFSWALFDEPFSHLDKENIRSATQLILNECEKRRAGAMMVSLGDTFGWKFDRQYHL